MNIMCEGSAPTGVPSHLTVNIGGDRPMRQLSSLTLAFFLVVTASSVAFAQTPEEKPVPEDEAAFEAMQSEVQAEMRAAMQARDFEQIDRLQHVYAGAFADFYRERPEMELGHEALQSAFHLWGMAGTTEAIEEILPEIPKSSDVWSGLIPSINNAYHGAGRLDDLEVLLDRLSEELTDPEARSRALRWAGTLQTQRGNDEKARSYFEEIIELDADEQLVDFAEGTLYELDALNVGQPAPDFTAETLEGEPLSLSDYRGDVVLLTFWSTGCGFSVDEIEYWRKAYRQHEGDGLQVIGAALDRDRERLASYVDEEDAGWPQIMLEEGFDAELAERYNVTGTPTIYVIGPDGDIVANAREHDLRGDSLIKTLAGLLEE